MERKYMYFNIFAYGRREMGGVASLVLAYCIR
jgi:hypothetical protein